MPSSPKTSAAFTVLAGSDRRHAQRAIGPDSCRVKISASDTNGAFALFEYIGRAEGGPPLHVHPDQDEIFVVQEGCYAFLCGNVAQTLNPGDTIFLPRGIPHTFRQTSPTGRLLFMFTPAGDMEAFFEELATIDGVPAPSVATAVFAAHGMAVVGPPID